MSIIENCTASAIKDAATSLLNGNLVAFPTETVYGLGADAQSKDAVAKIYQAKGRPVNHPLIVHLSSIEHLDKWARDIPDYAIVLARTFWPGPITLILPRTELAKDFTTGGQDNVGIRVPSHTVALALLKEFEAQGGLGVAAPSANRFGAVSPTTAVDVFKDLSKYLGPTDLILDGGATSIGVESTIVDCTQETPRILRPGGVTSNTISKLLGLKVINLSHITSNIKAPGILKSHYSPIARVLLSGAPSEGDGFIALASIPTPIGAIRLIAPEDNEEYARNLYSALRAADSKGLSRVYVVIPTEDGIGQAIIDRLKKASQ